MFLYSHSKMLKWKNSLSYKRAIWKEKMREKESRQNKILRIKKKIKKIFILIVILILIIAWVSLGSILLMYWENVENFFFSRVMHLQKGTFLVFEACFRVISSVMVELIWLAVAGGETSFYSKTKPPKYCLCKHIPTNESNTKLSSVR